LTRRLALLLLVASSLLGLAGCGTVTTLIDTQNALHAAGYQSVSVSPQPRTNSLDVQVTVSAPPGAANSRDVASIVWRTFHDRFDYAEITVHGQGPALVREYSFLQMEKEFGARNPAWNRTTVKSGTLRVGVTVAVGIVVVVAAVIGVVLMVRRRNRRPRWPGGPRPGTPPGTPPAWGPPPGPPPAWGPPAGWGPPPPG
jgi:hypothetical protein